MRKHVVDRFIEKPCFSIKLDSGVRKTSKHGSTKFPMLAILSKCYEKYILISNGAEARLITC